MKVKKIIFTAFFLAAASLGFALPSTRSSINDVSRAVTLADTPLGQALGGGLGDLSKNCQSALLTVITSPEFLKCIPVTALIPLVPILTDPSIIQKVIQDPKTNYKTIEGPLVQFADIFCPAPKCSDKGVSAAVQTISTGCADDLKKNDLIKIVFAVTVFYSPIHDNVCFKTKGGKVEYCFDESVLTIINLPPSPFKLTKSPLLDSIAVADPDAVCTKCNKDMINTFFNYLEKSDLKDTAKQILAGLGVDQKALDGMSVGSAVKCGLSFIDGKTP